MRELKILAVVVVITLIGYWGVEPFAHSQMHPEVKPPNYDFKDVDGLNGLKGNATNGATLVKTNCTACHSIIKEGVPALMDHATSAAAYGVVPPDLSTAGKLYDENYLAAFIKNPAKTSHVDHRFVEGKVYPMLGYSWMKPQQIADIVAYLQSIAPKQLSNKEVFVNACQRCHGIKYGDMEGGSMAAITPSKNLKAYLGKIPPDLSQYIISRGPKYLHEFINDPQKHLKGTAMPRVGLTKASEVQVISYMEEVGNSKKDERENLGPKVLIYLVIFAVFAWLWKMSKWREVH